MKCNKCGSDLRAGAGFCTVCGTRIENLPPAPPIQQPLTPWTPPQNTIPVQPGNLHAFDSHVYKTQMNTSAGLMAGGRKKANTGLIIGIVIACLVLLTSVIAGFIFLGSITGTPSIADPVDPVKPPPGAPDGDIVIITKDIEEFDIFLNEMFEEWVTNDALTMNYYLADPYVMGIERPEPTFGEVTSAETIKEAREDTEKIYDRLNGFRYENLREDQQIIYDIIKRIITLSRIMEQSDEYFYYNGYIRPLNGIQVQLPILLAEFSFYTADDIERYLDLIGDTYRYFSEIIEFERERSRRGYFLCPANTDSVIEQIEGYLENREDNLLITVFDYRIDNYEGLSSEQREDYKEKNKELILGNVLPAYDSLLEAMKDLRGVGARQGGLAKLPGGSEYAHAWMRLRIGTDRSTDEWLSLLGTWIDVVWQDLIDGLHGEAQLLDRYLNDELGDISDGTPEEYIFELVKRIAVDFPQIKPTQLVVLEVHESLQEHMSPAFYLSPAIDRFNDNVVYVNPASINSNIFMYTVLAHESYAGHMYQTVYFLQQSPHPVRVMLSNTGYSEGWATYAEMMSYFYAGLDEAEAAFLWNERFFYMLLGAYVDLGVNMKGWDLGYVTEFLSQIGYSEEGAEYMYNNVTGVPLMTMTYAMGYIEMILLKNEAERQLMSDFNLMEFHRFILETGSVPFPIIREYMYYWMEEYKASLQPAA